MLKAKYVPYEVKLRLRAVLHDGECDEAVAIAAAINAWPGMLVEWHSRGPGIILPLPQETRDE